MTGHNNRIPVEILLVEDSPGDALLMKEALKGGRIAHNMQVVANGVDALDYLHRSGRFAEAIRPDIILLDLNLPRKDGREVLAEIKADPDLKKIPVVVITTSSSEEDILKTYNLHANCYVQKPLGWGQFLEAVRAIENFWFSIVKLPPRRNG